MPYLDGQELTWENHGKVAGWRCRMKAGETHSRLEPSRDGWITVEYGGVSIVLLNDVEFESMAGGKYRQRIEAP